MPKPQISKKKSYRRPLIVIGIILVVIILLAAYELTGFGYTVARIRCGHDPIVGIQSFAEKDYYTPDNTMYRYYAHDGLSNYFCSEKEAQAAGFTKF